MYQVRNLYCKRQTNEDPTNMYSRYFTVSDPDGSNLTAYGFVKILNTLILPVAKAPTFGTLYQVLSQLDDNWNQGADFELGDEVYSNDIVLNSHCIVCSKFCKVGSYIAAASICCDTRY